MAYYTKVRIKEDTELYFNSFENFHEFINLFFNSNKNIEYIEVAQSNATEFLENIGE